VFRRASIAHPCQEAKAAARTQGHRPEVFDANAAAANSRNPYFCTLPVTVIGNAATKSRLSGCFNERRVIRLTVGFHPEPMNELDHPVIACQHVSVQLVETLDARVVKQQACERCPNAPRLPRIRNCDSKLTVVRIGVGRVSRDPNDALMLFRTDDRHECHAAVVIHVNELLQERGRRLAHDSEHACVSRLWTKTHDEVFVS